MAPIMLVMLAITVILIPVSLLAAIVLVVATAFGWIAVGYEVGRRVAQAFQWVLQPAVSAGLGTLLLTFVIGAVSWVPCVGWIAFPLVGSLGLGAVLLTRFGSQDYHPAPVSYSPPAPAPWVARDPSEAQAGTEPESNLPALDESQEADETPAGEDETEQ
jgi:hypothetical protein